MKHKIYIYILAIIAFNSCFKLKKFTLYKEAIYDEHAKIRIRTDGVYFAEQRKNKSEDLSRYLVFYSDGTVFMDMMDWNCKYWDKNKWEADYVEKINKSKTRWYMGYAYSDFGVYAVRDSIIKIQYFTLMDSYNQGVTNRYLKIINDTTILMYFYEDTYRVVINSYSVPNHVKYVDKNIFGGMGRYTEKIEPPIEYNFHKYDIKDTCVAWFYKKRWYRKYLHESRKQNNCIYKK